MVTYQITLPGLARDFSSLTPEENDFIQYFSSIDQNCIAPVISCYTGIGPKGYGTFLILARIIKVKECLIPPKVTA